MSKNKSKTKIELTCLACRTHFANIKTSKFKGYYHSSTHVTSQGLSCHLNSSKTCDKYYRANFLKPDGKTFNYLSSIISHKVQQAQNKEHFQSSQLGLTMTTNGPIVGDTGSDERNNSNVLLNQQVLYNGFWPRL